ncbi:hypothetical protein [Corynebacterium casei]|uniref:hypothetical protein n=1 Tax=Corynebacterium casei TaxID=160386 RepID=UPI003F8EB8FA
MNEDIYEILKDEIDIMQDWIPFTGAIGACDIHAHSATNEHVSALAKVVREDPRIVTAFHIVGEPMEFHRDSKLFDEVISEILESQDERFRMDLMANLFLDINNPADAHRSASR